MKRALIAIVSIVSCILMVSSVSAYPPATWQKGDEVAVFGHSFDEEYWTNSSIKVQNAAKDNITFSASYVNYSGVQAFLIALNMVENQNGSGTVPFQMFGLHYTTPEDREVFISAVLAFMMVFNDTHNGTSLGANNLPDPGNEDTMYVIPFGAASAVGNSSYVPVANVLPVEKLGIGHYRFGIQYLNMYAYVTGTPLLSMLLKTGLVAKFSELKVMYEITMDNTTGEVKTETWYTIGQVTELWGFLLGIPFQMDPKTDISPNLGLSVVHFVTVFTSKYVGATGNTSQNTFNPNVTKSLNEDITLKVGNNGERAMKIGTRGNFDLVNETSGATVEADKTAYSAIVGAHLMDLWLVAWQLGFAAGSMSIFAYAMSDYVKSKYEGPLDLANRSLAVGNSDGFNAHALWYAVSFPHWQGYKIVYDPTYTAYTNIATQDTPPAMNVGILMAGALIVIPIAAVIIVIVASRKKKGV
jgi:hypothetical protein